MVDQSSPPPPNTSTPTTASEWKQNQGTDLPLPSGNVAKVRNPGIRYFLAAGIIPNAFKTTILKSLNQARAGGKVKDATPELADMLQDEDNFEAMLAMLDKVLVEVVIEPDVTLGYQVNEESGKEELIPLSERDRETLYSDEVDFEDKIFIFNFACGGSRDIERFRQRQDAVLENLQHG